MFRRDSSKTQMSVDKNLVYLNHAAVGPLPKASLLELIETYNGQSQKGEASLDLDHMMNLWEELRMNIANLVHGKPAGVTLTTNTASGLHIVADGLVNRFKPKMNIVITDLEFTTNSYVWQKLAKRYQMELRVVPFIDGHFDQWNKYIDDHTIIVAVSQVQFSNGYRISVAELSEIVHNHGAFLVLDSIQALGVVPTFAEKDEIDFIAAGGYKWLLGPLGTGFLHVHPSRLNELDSVLVGWFGDREFFRMSHHEFEPWEDARQYQQSFGPNYAALNESIKQIIRWQPEQTLQHITGLHDYLIEKMLDIENVSLGSTIDTDHRSGIVRFNHPQAEQIVEKLKSQNIIVSYRDGAIRVSPHRYNTEYEMDLLVKRFRKMVKTI